MGTGLWSQQGNWEQTGDESGSLLMGALCLWGGAADMSVGGSRRTDAPTLQRDVTRHPLPDGGIERDLFALPPRRIHPPPLFSSHCDDLVFLSGREASLH